MQNKKLFKILILLCVIVSVVITGCQTPGKVVSEEVSPVCPTCKTTLKTSAIKNINYSQHVCPSCRQTHIPGPDNDGSIIHVCDKCKKGVSKCPQCARK